MDVKAVLGNGVFSGYEFLNPVPPIPELHGNLLVFGPRVVEMRIPPRVEGILGGNMIAPLVSIHVGIVHLPVQRIYRSDEWVSIEVFRLLLDM